MARLADDLYTWRVLNHMTQLDAAGWAGVSLTTWSRWERGLTEPGEDHYNTLQWLIGDYVGREIDDPAVRRTYPSGLKPERSEP